MSVLPLFPTLLHIVEVNNFDLIQKEIIDFCYDQKKLYPESQHRSNKGNSWHSKTQYMKTINILSQTLFSTLFDYFENSGVFKKGINFSFHNAWININSTGGYNDTHNHPGSLLSGVLWVKCSKNCGNIFFDNPTIFTESKITNEMTQEAIDGLHTFNSYYRIPEEGVVLLFPSHLLHRVELNESNEDRISISFNLSFG